MFAGEVFPEWYWGPIFFMVVFGLPLSAAALAVDFAVRRWVRRLAWPERAGLWVGVLAGGSLAILGGSPTSTRCGRSRRATSTQEGLVEGPLGRMAAWTSTFRPTMS